MSVEENRVTRISHLATAFSILCAIALTGASGAGPAGRIPGELLERGSANLDLRGLDLPPLRTFYAARSQAPAWSGSPAARNDARIALEALAGAGAEGLDPARYHVPAIALRQKAAAADAPEASAEYDVLMSDGVLRYVRDLREGRGELRTLDSDVALPEREFDAAAALGAALREGRLAQFLAALPPPYPEYARLRSALARYRGIDSAGGWPRIADTIAGPLDAATEQTGRLRERLSFEIAKAADPASDLVQAVEAFQRRHGLEPDGRVGNKTLAALNVPASQRADEIAANMERWRWLPRTLGPRHISVNAAGATLAAVEDGRVVLTSNVIAGKPRSPTAIFAAEAVAVTLNPVWNIPVSIARGEILPKARRNPSYLRARRIVADASGRLRQLPGRNNALGQVKLEMPNRFSIYLHDTPARTLFARAERHLSHGCVRVERIRPLASFAMTGDPERALPEIRERIAGGTTERISLDKPVPVYVLYWTAVANEDGSVDFFPDVYGRDGRLLATIAGKPVARRISSNAGSECRNA
jgi:murein L,D-transpeptidase YcbB/YkuD